MNESLIIIALCATITLISAWFIYIVYKKKLKDKDELYQLMVKAENKLRDLCCEHNDSYVFPLKNKTYENMGYIFDGKYLYFGDTIQAPNKTMHVIKGYRWYEQDRKLWTGFLNENLEMLISIIELNIKEKNKAIETASKILKN